MKNCLWRSCDALSKGAVKDIEGSNTLAFLGIAPRTCHLQKILDLMWNWIVLLSLSFPLLAYFIYCNFDFFYTEYKPYPETGFPTAMTCTTLTMHANVSTTPRASCRPIEGQKFNTYCSVGEFETSKCPFFSMQYNGPRRNNIFYQISPQFCY